MMVSLGKAGNYYFNYKGYHSVVLLAIVDVKYNFLAVFIGGNGRISDGDIFSANISDFLEQSNSLEKVPLLGRTLHITYVFIADDAFSLKQFIIKSYPYNSKGAMRIHRVYIIIV